MKTYKFLFALIIGLSIVGCSDLQEEPVGLLAPEGFFQSTADIQSAVNATYAHAFNEEVWGRKLSIALMLRSDMVEFTPAGTTARRLEHDNLEATTNNEMIYDPWGRIYQGIAAANAAISGAALVDVPDDEKNRVLGQAYFMRAFYYFHLVRLFGGVPYLSEPVTATTAEAMASISRTPASEVYENIISDLEYAKTWLPETQDSRSIPAKSAASSYLALVYLTRAGTNGAADFQLAYNEAKEVIDNAGTYELALDADFQNLFNADKIDDSKEPIFALDYNNVEAADNGYDQIAPMTGIRGNARHGSTNPGWSQAIPALEVYERWDSNDYRRAVSFDDRAVFLGDHDGDPNTDNTIMEYSYDQFGTAPGSVHAAAVPRPYIAKYFRFPGAFARGSVRATSHNPSMLRYAEVLLIAAEAAVETGNNAEALNYINQVRARARAGGSWDDTPASATPADLVGTVTINDVMEERRLELAFECKRWYDIARRQLGDAANGDVFGTGGLEGAKPDFTATDYLLPIQANEISSNPNLTQNPGY